MEYKEALNRAASFCATAEHCRSEVTEKLQKWEVDAEDYNRILEYLLRENYLDEGRYAKLFVRDKYRINKWGRIKIEYSLRQKRVEQSAIFDALDTIDEELYLENLSDLLQAKRRSIKAKDPYDERAKLFRFAASRGFDSDEIKRILKQME